MTYKVEVYDSSVGRWVSSSASEAAQKRVADMIGIGYKVRDPHGRSLRLVPVPEPIYTVTLTAGQRDDLLRGISTDIRQALLDAVYGEQ